jgi:hypothetical protein
MNALHIQPKRRAVAAELAEAERHRRRYRQRARENAVQGLAANAKVAGRCGDRHIEGRKDILFEDFTWVSGHSLQIAGRFVSGHSCCSFTVDVAIAQATFSGIARNRLPQRLWLEMRT